MDALVYDMASMTEGSPSVFTRKDWISILDNQNGVYTGNQSVVDTAQLANSNKYINYREAYLAVPMVLTATGAANVAALVAPATAATSADMTFGLKNWFGSIVHSMTLDLAGTTIIQNTPFANMWNSFRLMTTLSLQDVLTNGAHMGFYPDDPLAFSFCSGANGKADQQSLDGVGTCNNQNYINITAVNAVDFGFHRGNIGFEKRQEYITYDPDARTGGNAAAVNAPFSSLLTGASAQAQYKSYIYLKQNPAAGVIPVVQYAIMGIIHLKHLHNFFQNVPLMKGLFMRLTLNLNQTTVTLQTDDAGDNTDSYLDTTVTVNSPLGGVSPIMIASQTANNGGAAALNLAIQNAKIEVSLAVGKAPILSSQSALSTGLPSSIQLYVPAYSMNPQYESAYLSSPVKKIVYTDIYQYRVNSITAGSTFNNLITNGIAGIQSVLVLPFFSKTANAGLVPYESPFDPAGCGPTSPLCLLTNFNVVIAGQNAIYNTQKYSYEQFLNQLYGANAINGGLTDGLTSSLVDKLGFEHEYCYYYVNASRGLPVDETVPKSVSIIGQNNSAKDIDLIVFVEYKVSVAVDVLSGSRVA